MLGPGAVQYGSDAIGGVLNALTPDAPEWTGEAVWNNALLYRGATAERSHIGRWSSAARPTPTLGMTGGFTWKEFGDVQGGRRVGPRIQAFAADEPGRFGGVDHGSQRAHSTAIRDSGPWSAMA